MAGELGGLDDAREELLVYQTLVGALPIERERLDALPREGAARGKVTTNWLAPDEEHERAVQEFAARAADAARARSVPRARARRGRRLALAQLLLKLTSPGVPDIYQGDELEDLSLVDPDNRRPVDWDARRAPCAACRRATTRTKRLRSSMSSGGALALRREHPDAFAGAYDPVDAGPGVCAFVRGGAVLVAAAVRPDAGVALPAGWRDVLGMQGLALGTLGAGSGCRSPGPSNT